jgi:hypothetical protein
MDGTYARNSGDGAMLNRCVTGCGSEGTHTLKIESRAPHSEVIAPAILFAMLHRMTEESITEFLDANWRYFCLGFEV